jgi:hypothetical protein
LHFFFLLLFEQEFSHLHFVLGLTDYVVRTIDPGPKPLADPDGAISWGGGRGALADECGGDMLGRGHSATLCSYSPQQPALPSCKPQAPTLLRFSTPRHSSRAVEILVGLPIGQLLSDTEREVANTTSKSSQTFALPQASWIFQHST